MAIAKITIIGFSNYLSNINDDLFKYLNVPEGIDKETLVNNILLRGAEFEVLYSDPYFFQNMIGVWSDKWQRTMEKWAEALSIEYNPLENYDRMEDWEDNGSKFSAENKKNDIAGSRSNINQSLESDITSRNENAVSQDISKSTGNGDTTNTRSAYDSPGYQPHDKSESHTTGDNTSNGVTSANGNTAGTKNAINQTIGNDNESTTQTANAIDKTNGVHSGRVHGNIGVTTSQQMLEAQLKIVKWNVYEEITNLFLSEFCIYVY